MGHECFEADVSIGSGRVSHYLLLLKKGHEGCCVIFVNDMVQALLVRNSVTCFFPLWV